MKHTILMVSSAMIVCVRLKIYSVLFLQEVLQTIPKFCFPFDVERYDSSPSLPPFI